MSLLPVETLRLVSVILDCLGTDNRVRFLEIINKGLKGDEVISQQRFNRIFNKDTRTMKYPEIPTQVLRAVALNTDYDVNWILTGEGDLHKTKTSPTSVEERDGSNVQVNAEDIMSLLREINDEQKIISANLKTISDPRRKVPSAPLDKSELADLEERAAHRSAEIATPGYGKRNPPVKKKETKKP